jgi:hypothetical protein
MKLLKYLIILLAASVVSSGQPPDRFPPIMATPAEARMLMTQGGVPVVAGCTSITVDVNQTLEASDFLTSPPSLWSNTDANGLFSMSASGELATIKCPGGVADTGTKGLAKSLNNAANAAYVQYEPVATLSNVSIGFWYKTVSVGAWEKAGIVDFGGSSDKWWVQEMDGSGSEYLRKDGDATKISISVNTWYWLTLVWNRNATSYFAVYDTTGTQVGSTASFTADDWDISYILFGYTQNSVNKAATQYFDDIWIDWTNHAFPLGP